MTIFDGAKGGFRPLPLASLTAFSGFTALTLERATQVQFLVPSACALVVGIMITTGTPTPPPPDPPLLCHWESTF